MTNINKTIFKILCLAFCASVLTSPNLAHGIATVNSLDFVLADQQNFDCNILGKVDLEHDPSWTNEEFFVHLVEQYNVDNSGGEYASIEEYRAAIDQAIADNWSDFFGMIFFYYGGENIEGFWDNTDLYRIYNTNFKDLYRRAFILDQINVSRSEANNLATYSVVGNYCDTESGSSIIDTKFARRGYPNYLKFGDREVAINDHTITALKDGYIFHEDGFGDLEVRLSRINSTTIKATYAIKNLTGLATNYGLAFHTDTRLGENDASAVWKTNRKFTVIQDNPDYDYSFGTKLEIELNPAPTTSYVGEYGYAETDRWNNSQKDAYTAADDVRTGISYSWQGQIGANETKTFTATYNMSVSETFDNYFYYLSNSYAAPLTTVSAIDDGAMTLPSTAISTRPGYHYGWNSSADGKGTIFEGGSIIVADKNRPNFYEVEIPNEIIAEIEKDNERRITEYNVVITDGLKEKLSEIVQSALSNIDIFTYIYELYDEDADVYFDEDKTISREEIINTAGEEYSYSNLFRIYEAGAEYLDGTATEQTPRFTEDYYPLTMRIKLNNNYIKDKNNFGVVKIKHSEDLSTFEEYTLLPSTFDHETGELIFEVDSIDEYDMYALVYVEIPAVPSTGAGKIKANLSEVLIILPALTCLAVAFVRLKNRRNHRIIFY